MSKVTIELSEYNNLRDRAKMVEKSEEKVKELEKKQSEQIEELQKQGKVAVMIRYQSLFDFGSKPTLEKVANLDDVKDEVKEFFEKEQKAEVLKKEFDKLKESVVKPLEEVTKENEKLKATIDNIKLLPWWKRLFNKF